MSELRKFIIGRCFDPAKPSTGSMGVVAVDSIQKQHMKMDVQVQRTAKALDQGNSAGVCRGFCIAGFVGQMRGNAALSAILRAPQLGQKPAIINELFEHQDNPAQKAAAGAFQAVLLVPDVAVAHVKGEKRS